MKVLLIGSGGREHALALAIVKSPNLEKLYILPGNPGTALLGTNLNFDQSDFGKIAAFCQTEKIDLVVVGPEKPLTDGITDFLNEKGINVFGPTKNAARIEGEKSFSKKLMKDFGIPTAAFEVFGKENYNDAVDYLNKSSYPIVIKADGLAAGKGVTIAANFDEAVSAIDDCFIHSSFGASGDKVVIEEFMTGQEASVFAVTDGSDFVLLPPAQDHKRIWDGDKGKNTGGMGAYAPTPFVTDDMMNRIAAEIVRPTLDALKSVGAQFVGCLYCGLMLTDQGPKVVEFNCRFGDPETQVVLPLINGDFLTLLYSAALGKLDKNALIYNGGSSVCVVVASKGYPDSYEKGKLITGLDETINEDTIIYHAGTVEKEGQIYTNGGRVLGVTSIIMRNNLMEAKQRAYEALNKIKFDGMQFRTDIADKALNLK